MMIFKLVK